MSKLENISIHYYILFFKNNLSLEHCYSLVILNTVIYSSLLVYFFSVFFLFDFKVFKSLNEYKFFKTTGFFNTTIVIILMSLAGVPPLLGFFTKFFLFATLLSLNQILFFTLFLVLNLFIIFFYVQNIRFLVSKTPKNIFLFINFKVYLNFQLIKLLVFFNFLTVSAFLYFEYILITIYQCVLFLKVY